MFWLYKTTHQNLVIFVEISINVDKKRSNSGPNQSVGVKKTALANTFAKISIWSLWQNSCGSATLFAHQVDHSIRRLSFTSPCLQQQMMIKVMGLDLMVSLWLAFQSQVFFHFHFNTLEIEWLQTILWVNKTLWHCDHISNISIPPPLGCKLSPCYS